MKSQYTQNIINSCATYTLSKAGLSALTPIILLL